MPTFGPARDVFDFVCVLRLAELIVPQREIERTRRRTDTGGFSLSRNHIVAPRTSRRIHSSTQRQRARPETPRLRLTS